MNQTSHDIGTLLRTTRENRPRPLSLQECSVQLKIRAKYLQAIEEGDISELPSPVYLCGYLKSYADFLGLDGNLLYERYKAEKDNHPHHPELYLPEPYRKDLHPRPLALLVSLALTAAVYFGCYHYHLYTNLLTDTIAAAATRPDTSEVASAAPSASNQYPASFPAVSENIAAYKGTLQSSGSTFVLVAKSDAWIKVLDDKSELLSEKLLHAGDAYFVTPEKGRIITVDNVANVDVMKNGQPSSMEELNLSHSNQVLAAPQQEAAQQ